MREPAPQRQRIGSVGQLDRGAPGADDGAGIVDRAAAAAKIKGLDADGARDHARVVDREGAGENARAVCARPANLAGARIGYVDGPPADNSDCGSKQAAGIDYFVNITADGHQARNRA